MPTTRIPVTLKDADTELMIKLEAALQARLNRRLSIADIVRIALRTQAKAEGIQVIEVID